jgi:hypothetical protein
MLHSRFLFWSWDLRNIHVWEIAEGQAGSSRGIIVEKIIVEKNHVTALFVFVTFETFDYRVDAV